MAQVLALALFVAAFAIWWRYAARQKSILAAAAAKRDARSRFHCVEVRTGVPACEAARRLGNVRYLGSEAPRLPVSGCTEHACTCRYVHHADRREAERRNPYGQWTNLPPVVEGERRSRFERRTSQEGMFRPSIAR